MASHKGQKIENVLQCTEPGQLSGAHTHLMGPAAPMWAPVAAPFLTPSFLLRLLITLLIELGILSLGIAPASRTSVQRVPTPKDAGKHIVTLVQT